jgi:hypothetical protein
MWNFMIFLAAAGVASRFLNAGVVNMLMAFAMIYVILGITNTFITSPLNKGLALIGTLLCLFVAAGVISDYIEKRHPRLYEARVARETYAGYKAADAAHPKYPLVLANSIYQNEMDLLSAQQAEVMANMDAVTNPPMVTIKAPWYKFWAKDKVVPDPKWTPPTYERAEAAIAAAKTRLGEIDKRMKTVRLIMNGGNEATPSTTRSTRSYGGNAIETDTVVIDHVGTYNVKPEAGPVTMKVKGCYHLEWDAKISPIEINANGRRYVEPVGPDQVNIAGNMKQFQIRNLEGKDGEFVLVASSK